MKFYILYMTFRNYIYVLTIIYFAHHTKLCFGYHHTKLCLGTILYILVKPRQQLMSPALPLPARLILCSSPPSPLPPPTAGSRLHSLVPPRIPRAVAAPSPPVVAPPLPSPTPAPSCIKMHCPAPIALSHTLSSCGWPAPRAAPKGAIVGASWPCEEVSPPRRLSCSC
jgi:hypothetical protein